MLITAFCSAQTFDSYLNRFGQRSVVLGDQRGQFALVARARSATNTVQVVDGRLREIKQHYVMNVRGVQTSSR
jgi:hypothetical protein